jgi:hypothetical protein
VVAAPHIAGLVLVELTVVQDKLGHRGAPEYVAVTVASRLIISGVSMIDT